MKTNLNAAVLEAIAQRRLMHWYVDGFRRTVEPHMYATISGNRQVVICYRIDSGGSSERTHFWNVIDAAGALELAAGRFASARDIPEVYTEIVRTVHAKV